MCEVSVAITRTVEVGFGIWIPGLGVVLNLRMQFLEIDIVHLDGFFHVGGLSEALGASWLNDGLLKVVGNVF